MKGHTRLAGQPAQAESWLARQSKSINELLHPFSDKAINAKLLSLCLAQALCSVATLIHDTYLPIYLQDVLGALPAMPLFQQGWGFPISALAA